MNSKKNVLIALLALSTVACGVFGWQQYQRAAKPAATADSHDELLKKLAAAERRAADLEARLAALQADNFPSENDPPPPSATETARPVAGRPQGPGNRRGAMPAWMNNPEVVQLMTEQQKASLDGRYAALFKQLNLSPAQLDAFKLLLIEKQNAQRDVMSAAAESGLNPRENRQELEKLVAEARAETDAAIAAAIGQDKFSQYQTYENTSSQRFMVEQIGRTMSYAANPLTEQQSQALVQILSQGAEPSANDIRRGGPVGPWGGARAVEITDAMIAQASTILSPEQLRVIQEQQANQQNSRRLNQLMRENRQRN